MSDTGRVSNRDRDSAGRPRNSRPRDELGRPLPYGAIGTERAPEGVVRSPAQTLELAQELLDQGRPFHAHEVFEDAWKTATDPAQRPLWQALAQLAVGLTHAARGNPDGHRTLLRRATVGLTPFADACPHGIDVAGIVEWVELDLRGANPVRLRLSAPAPRP